MSGERPGGWWQRLVGAVRCRFGGVFDGGGASAAAGPSLGSVQLQLTVWDQRL
ncbi:hypothetical protein [Arthrobacter sp. ZGTC412]|uniref:hypothetical protein n=1 Tax=Arthrobacter sp. ZGTC412 TaxID=2058900 RepID=UPI0015E3C4A4|nr:hypothetical protein [Arthrobacter sp. ZGTC412]